MAKAWLSKEGRAFRDSGCDLGFTRATRPPAASLTHNFSKGPLLVSKETISGAFAGAKWLRRCGISMRLKPSHLKASFA